MNREQMAERYSYLLNEHTILGNQIASIKGGNFELNQSQLNEVKKLEYNQNLIENEIQKMMINF
jgi:hypothetical protein